MNTNQRNRTKRFSRRGGSVLVELALVLPFCLMFLLGLFDYCRYLMTLDVFNNAAREGARYALTHTQPVIIQGTTYGNANSDVTNIVNASLAGQQLGGQSVQVYASDNLGNNVGAWTNAQAGEYICVKITGTFTFVAPKMIMLPSTMPLTAQAVMRSESN